MSTPKKPGSTKPDALDLLAQDHAKVRDLFRQMEELKGLDEQEERKAELADEICYELSVHATLEEEIFYPAVRSLIDNDELIDECEVEHAGARDLISRLEVMYPGDEHYDATLAVLAEEVERHIDKEEGIIFPAARKAKLDMQRIGEQLQARKEQLEDDLSSPPSSINGLGADDDEGLGHGRRPA